MKTNPNRFLARILAVLVVCGLAACTKTATEGPTDASIGEAIKASYYSDPALKGDRVDVSVSNGEVTLAGEVSSDTARLQAYKLANETPGVKKVNDMLQVKPTETALQPPVEQPATGKAPAAAPKASSAGRPSQAPSSPMTPAPAAASGAAPRPAAPAPSARIVTVPAGTSIQIQMIDSIDSEKDKIGETFLASLAAPIRAGNEVVVPKDTDIYVKLTDAKTSGTLTGRSELRLQLDHVKYQGKTYELSSTTYEQVGASRGKDTVKKTAIGAAIGTAIGAIAGGGKGAAIGAGVGAGSGTAAQVFMKGKQVKVPAETKLKFDLEQPVEFTLPPSR